ncbi:MAG: glycosyltransferase family 2 protein [Phycisphaerales bacterium]|nr:glycosyltransferase family 2 protein [Phycisphaerales bacterium]MCB9862391.1 glycosyltransferase family 2 protein [Phycisphaerales bacterium]
MINAPSEAARKDTTAAVSHRRRALSVVAPVHNEELNLEDLHSELSGVLQSAGLDYEIIYVDDGSRDTSLKILKSVADRDERVIVVELRRNFGQTAAMAAGIEHSCGDVIIPIDADLQNDPNDIPRLLDTLNGTPRYDIVSGWRKDRKDKMVTRRIPSQIANAIISRVTNVPIHDFGCTLKAYRREVLEDVSLSSDLHRFLPALAAWHGANITELVVNHRPRTRGVTKYGLARTIRVLLDLVIVKFLGTYMTKPLLFFGKIGMATFGFALLILAIAVGQKFGYFGQPEGLNLNRNILVSLSALLAFFTVQCVLFGLMAELLVRVYQDGRGRKIYRVREVYSSAKAGDA